MSRRTLEREQLTRLARQRLAAAEALLLYGVTSPSDVRLREQIMDEIPAGPIYVIAGNTSQAEQWAANRGLPLRAWRYIADVGVVDFPIHSLILTGTWEQRPDANAICRLIAIRRDGSGVQSSHEPVIPAADSLCYLHHAHHVHHINGDPRDNRPENLRLVPGGSWSRPRATYDGTVAAFSDAPTRERAGAVLAATRGLFAEALGAFAISGLDDHRARAHTPLPTEIVDNVTGELMDLARANDEVGFRALAACYGPAEDVDALWARTRARVGR